MNQSYPAIVVTPANGHALAVTDSGRRRARRGDWFLVFFFSGLVALFSAMVLPFNPQAAFPFMIVSWPLATLAGYRIWRIDHPNDSARAVLRQRLVLYGRAALRALTLGVIDSTDAAGSNSNGVGHGGESNGGDGF